jgi:hypothetical protein
MREKNSQTSLRFGALVVMGILGFSSCESDIKLEPDIDEVILTTTIATLSAAAPGSDSTQPTNPPQTTIPRTTTSSPPTTIPRTTTSSPPTTIPRTTTISPSTSSDLKTMACLDQGGRVEIDEEVMMAYCYVNNKIFDRWGIK